MPAMAVVAARGASRTGRACISALACALAAHALAYRSLVPTDAEHGYFGAYVPAVGGLTAVAVLALAALAALRLLGRGAALASLLAPAGGAGRRRVLSILLSALVVLAVQESLELRLAGEPASAEARHWPLLGAAAIVVSVLISLASRTYASLVAAIPPPCRQAPSSGATPRQAPACADPLRPSVLAARGAGRAPPSLAT